MPTAEKASLKQACWERHYATVTVVLDHLTNAWDSTLSQSWRSLSDQAKTSSRISTNWSSCPSRSTSRYGHHGVRSLFCTRDGRVVEDLKLFWFKQLKKSAVGLGSPAVACLATRTNDINRSIELLACGVTVAVMAKWLRRWTGNPVGFPFSVFQVMPLLEVQHEGRDKRLSKVSLLNI